MFNWVCPQCGHDVPPSKTECPHCAELAREAAAAGQPVMQPMGLETACPGWQQPPAQQPPAPPPQPAWNPPPAPHSPPAQTWSGWQPAPQPPQPPPPPPQWQPAPEPQRPQQPSPQWQPAPLPPEPMRAEAAHPPFAPAGPAPPPQFGPPQHWGPPPPGMPPGPPPPPPPGHRPPPGAWQTPAAKPGLPTWALTVIFALAFLLIGAAVYFGIQRFSRTNPAEKAGLQEPASGAAAKVSNPLQKYVEVVGIRMFDEKNKPVVRFVVVNHSNTEINDLGANVTLWASTSRSEEDAVGTFSFKAGTLAPEESKELTEPLSTKLKIYELPDWQNATAEISITSPQP